MSILPSHRQGLYYLEHCRVMSKDDRVSYQMEEGGISKFFAIPRENTNIILLGSGTSITQAASRMLAEDGVMIAFTGGGGSPLYLASQNEYRPTEYLQKWIQIWGSENSRLKSAKILFEHRAEYLLSTYDKIEHVKPEKNSLIECCNLAFNKIEKANDQSELLGYEANYAKELYRLWSFAFKHENFKREGGKKSRVDLFNSYLDHGNYLAYGLAATVLWVLGIPHSLPILHGKTRRGALVFDIADIVKDATIMPVAFYCAANKVPDNQMRARCIESLDKNSAMEKMFSSIKILCSGSL